MNEHPVSSKANPDKISVCLGGVGVAGVQHGMQPPFCSIFCPGFAGFIEKEGGENVAGGDKFAPEIVPLIIPPPEQASVGVDDYKY